MVDTERLNQLIWSMGLKFRAALVQETAPVPDWFPVQQALTLAATHIFLTLPDAIRRTLQHTTAEQLAQRGKRLGATVSPLTIWAFAYSFLVGREILIDFGVITPRTGTADIDLVLDFWRRLSFTHRGDGHLDNSEAAATNVFLPATITHGIYDALLPIDPSIRRRVEQFLTTTDEYLLLLNGETRLGIADSGPYPLNVERVLVVRDLFDLKGMFYPWRDLVTDLPLHTCSLAFTFDPEDFHTFEFSDQSALRTNPTTYTAAIREIAFLSNDSGSPQVLPFTEMDWLIRAIAKVRPRLEDWFNRQPRRQRILAGAVPWIARAFAVLSTDEVTRASELSPQALALLPHYEEDDPHAARWMTHRCLAPGTLSAFVSLS
ncbi:MAG: hypothetical protein EXR78_02975 [Deltaproteobacteria bacterium]|nr:hypothetical protein [Deltaproteobacteria bacterium]